MQSYQETAFGLPAGTRLFPLIPNTKKPAIKNWQTRATDNPDILKDWFEGPFKGHNVGVATGHGLVVIDADTKDGAPGLDSLDMLFTEGMPEGFQVQTPSGGRHVYLYSDDAIRNSVKRLSNYPGIDIRGEGGYVVAPPSALPNGAYTPLNSPNTRHKLPAWLAEELKRKKHEKVENDTPAVELDLQDNIDKAQNWLTENAPIALSGENGNDTTYRVAAQIRHFGISESTAFELISVYWNEAGKAEPPWQPEDLQRIIENAYKYASGEWGGASGLSEFGDATKEFPDLFKDAPAKTGLTAISFEEAVTRASTHKIKPLIEDVITQSSFVVMYGPSNSGKSFVMLDMAYGVAAGTGWNGHKAHKAAVMYVAAEGGVGMYKRFAALKKHYGADGAVPLYLCNYPVNFLEGKKDAKALLAEIKRIQKENNVTFGMIVVDTLARAMAGGDENASKDMGAFIENVGTLQAKTDATLTLVHHTGKDVARGARGWSGLRAAVDTEIELNNNAITVSKQRDIEPIEAVRFRLKPVEVDAETKSCVVTYLEPNEFLEIPLNPEETRVLSAFREVGEASDDMDAVASVEVRELLSDARVSKAGFQRALVVLCKQGYLKKRKKGYYAVLDPH